MSRSRDAASSQVTSGFQPPACNRPDCPFVRSHGPPRRHGYCCNACRYGEAQHTQNCTGFLTSVATAVITHEVVEEPEPETIPASPRMYRNCRFRDRGPTVCDTFCIPPAWACGDGDDDFMHHLHWFFDNYGLTPEWDVLRSWQESLQRRTMHRPLTIHVLSERNLEWLSQKYHGILLNRPDDYGWKPYYLDARSGQYNRHDVTGINWVVQATLLTQNSCYRALNYAATWIEAMQTWQSHPQFAFVCSHATHRSVGCAVLLATFIYKHARIRFTTPRTIQAAMDLGMVPCPE